MRTYTGPRVDTGSSTALGCFGAGDNWQPGIGLDPWWPVTADFSSFLNIPHFDKINSPLRSSYILPATTTRLLFLSKRIMEELPLRRWRSQRSSNLCSPKFLLWSQMKLHSFFLNSRTERLDRFGCRKTVQCTPGQAAVLMS